MRAGTAERNPIRPVRPPDDCRAAWLIARRGAVESLRDRMTVAVSAIWSLAVPILVVLLVIRPLVRRGGDLDLGGIGGTIAAYLLVVGLLPTSGATGIASGLFAGEKEQGTLLPLLATPASNRAIFAGKVLGAVLPTLIYAGLAELSYLLEVRLLLGASVLRQLPLGLTAAVLVLVPADAVLGAAVASLVSSRVRTYQSAQLLSSLALYPIMAGLFALAVQMQRWGPGLLLIAVATIIALDLLLIAVSATTWRRDEVLARR